MGAAQTAAKLNAAFLDVGAGDVQLYRGDSLGVGENSRHLGVFIDGRSAHVHDNGGAAGTKFGQFFVDETSDTDPLETDGVQHPRGRLDDSRWRMSFSFGEKQPL